MLPLVAMYESQVIPKDIKTNYCALTKTHIQYLNKVIHKPRQTNTSIKKHNQSSNTINQILNIINPLTNIEYQSSKKKPHNPIHTTKPKKNTIKFIYTPLNSPEKFAYDQAATKNHTP